MDKIIPYIPLFAFATAFVITYFSIPAIIRLSLVKKLYDLPDARKKHGNRISPLGGIAIFGGLIVSFVFFTAHLANTALNSVLVALFILFITGVKDDLYPLVPYKKLLGQILAVAIIIFQGDIRLEQLFGLFGIFSLSYIPSVIVTFIFFLGIINSFNFIDGINGLGSCIGILVSMVYSGWFWFLDEPLFLILALCIAGSQLAFLRYNFINAKIFMGDSGSMILGFFAALLSIYFLQANEKTNEAVLEHVDAVVFSLAVLIIPIADTLRVIFLRVFILRKSPFSADRNHIHHALIDIGFNHIKATITLFLANAAIIAMAWFLNPVLRAKYVLVVVLLVAFLLAQIPFFIKRKNKQLAAKS